MARDASLRSNGCTHGRSIAWHVMPHFESTAAHLAAAGITWLVMPHFESMAARMAAAEITWLVMPRSESMAARTAAASLGMWCLAPNQRLHTWQQHLLVAHGASLRSSGCMQVQISNGCTHGSSIA